jgi:hypothetical protein
MVLGVIDMYRWLFMFMVLVMFVFQSLGVLATEFKDPAFKVQFEYDDSQWVVVPPDTFKQRITLKHVDYMATLNVLAYRFNEPITVNRLVEKRIFSVYDGWQLIRQDTINSFDLVRKNMTEGVKSLYRKPVLSSELKQIYNMAVDITYVVDDNLSIILNLEVEESSDLVYLKSEFSSIVRSFWYGDEKKHFNYIVNNAKEWPQLNQNLSRNRVYNTSFSFQDTTKVIGETPLRMDVNEETKMVHNLNGTYLLMGSQLSFVDQVGGQDITIDTKLNQPEIYLNNQGVFVVQKAPYTLIRQYNVALEPVAQYRHDEMSLFVVNINLDFILMTQDTIRMIQGDAIKWQRSNDFDISFIVGSGNLIYFTDNQRKQLVSLDINTGDVVDTVSQVKDVFGAHDASFKFLDLGILDDTLFVMMAQKELTGMALIPFDNMTIDHTRAFEYKDVEVISISNGMVVIKYEDKDQGLYIEALDFNTFASVWKSPMDATGLAPVITNSQVLLVDAGQDIVSFSRLGGTNIRRINLQDLWALYAGADTEVFVEKIYKIVPDSRQNLMALIRTKTNRSALVYVR